MLRPFFCRPFIPQSGYEGAGERTSSLWIGTGRKLQSSALTRDKPRARPRGKVSAAEAAWELRCAPRHVRVQQPARCAADAAGGR